PSGRDCDSHGLSHPLPSPAHAIRPRPKIFRPPRRGCVRPPSDSISLVCDSASLLAVRARPSRTVFVGLRAQSARSTRVLVLGPAVPNTSALMFTGLVQSLAEVTDFIAEPPGARLTIRELQIAATAQIGDSIAINGCCLTVVDIQSDRFSFQAG